MTRKPFGSHRSDVEGPSGDFMMNCKRQVTRKPSGPIGRMEMESGPTGRMLKGPIGTRRGERDRA
jgi:hypothetical protein